MVAIRFLASLGLAFGLSATPTIAQAAVHQAGVPILYRYAACAFAVDEPTIEEQLEKCSDLREELEEIADEVMPRYYSHNRREARRAISAYFESIEIQAGLAREQGKTVPPSIVAYLACMGEGVMETEKYIDGVAVSYIGIEDRCVTDHVLSVTWVSSEQELERIQLLYKRFAITGRYLDSSRLGSGLDSTAEGGYSRAQLARRQRIRESRGPSAYISFGRGGFLDLDELPADKVNPNE